MKKGIISLLSVGLILATAACSSPSGSSVDQPVQSASEKDTSTKTGTKTAAPSTTAAQSQAVQTQPATQTETQPATQPAVTPIGDAAIEQQVLVDEKDIKITATGLATDGWMGPSLKVLIENNSNKDLTVQSGSTSINGYMVDSMISADVAAGKKANEEISFMTSELETAGIRTIADIEMSFHIFITDDYDDYLDTKPISIKSSIAEEYEYTFDDSGEVLYDEKGIRIIAKGISNDDSIFGPGLILFIENLGKKSITVQSTDVSVNGFMIDSLMSAEVSPQKRTIDALTFFQADMEENGIEKITDLELAFHIFETDKYDTIDDSKKYVLNFE